MRQKHHKSADTECITTAFTLLVPRAAILDCKDKVGEARWTQQVTYLTSGDVPVEFSHWELGKSDVPVQTEQIYSSPKNLTPYDAAREITEGEVNIFFLIQAKLTCVIKLLHLWPSLGSKLCNGALRRDRSVSQSTPHHQYMTMTIHPTQNYPAGQVFVRVTFVTTLSSMGYNQYPPIPSPN